jgi:exoribonuclease R
MSLKANKDVCALSLGVELADDGSIIDSSIIVTPSYVSVSYRLTYDEVDEMLEEGSGYHEEWQLGTLLTAASKRRQFRMRQGSSEEFIPTQIPQFSIATSPDSKAQDGISIQLKVQVSHNSGKNQSVVTASDADSSTSNEPPVSSACTLVTGT